MEACTSTPNPNTCTSRNCFTTSRRRQFLCKPLCLLPPHLSPREVCASAAPAGKAKRGANKNFSFPQNRIIVPIFYICRLLLAHFSGRGDCCWEIFFLHIAGRCCVGSHVWVCVRADFFSPLDVHWCEWTFAQIFNFSLGGKLGAWMQPWADCSSLRAGSKAFGGSRDADAESSARTRNFFFIMENFLQFYDRKFFPLHSFHLAPSHVGLIVRRAPQPRLASPSLAERSTPKIRTHSLDGKIDKMKEKCFSSDGSVHENFSVLRHQSAIWCGERCSNALLRSPFPHCTAQARRRSRFRRRKSQWKNFSKGRSWFAPTLWTIEEKNFQLSLVACNHLNYLQNALLCDNTGRPGEPNHLLNAKALEQLPLFLIQSLSLLQKTEPRCYGSHNLNFVSITTTSTGSTIVTRFTKSGKSFIVIRGNQLLTYSSVQITFDVKTSCISLTFWWIWEHKNQIS